MSKFPSPQWIPGNPNDRSVTGFRIRNGSAKGPMSRTLYFGMKARGDGPRETYITPNRIIITAADEQTWLEARANPSGYRSAVDRQGCDDAQGTWAQGRKGSSCEPAACVQAQAPVIGSCVT
jgi:hypothetical protein